jgi:hypothetical protein
MILAAGATLFFLLLHATVAHYARGQEFHVQLKLSRGLASVLLTAIGVYALLQWWALWPQAFLARHTPEQQIYALICIVSGHFIADFGLLAWGWLRHGSSPRKDLVAHHALGVVVCAVVFYYGFGHALFGAALTTELMPVTSGVAALAPLLHRPGRSDWPRSCDSASWRCGACRSGPSSSACCCSAWRLPSLTA